MQQNAGIRAGFCYGDGFRKAVRFSHTFTSCNAPFTRRSTFCERLQQGRSEGCSRMHLESRHLRPWFGGMRRWTCVVRTCCGSATNRGEGKRTSLTRIHQLVAIKCGAMWVGNSISSITPHWILFCGFHCALAFAVKGSVNRAGNRIFGVSSVGQRLTRWSQSVKAEPVSGKCYPKPGYVRVLPVELAFSSPGSFRHGTCFRMVMKGTRRMVFQWAEGASTLLLLIGAIAGLLVLVWYCVP